MTLAVAAYLIGQDIALLERVQQARDDAGDPLHARTGEVRWLHAAGAWAACMGQGNNKTPLA